tara:strand:- start:6234 stop:6500 length:267 start_codon:yes stop_codon:yes gene_type:complete
MFYKRRLPRPKKSGYKENLHLFRCSHRSPYFEENRIRHRVKKIFLGKIDDERFDDGTKPFNQKKLILQKKPDHRVPVHDNYFMDTGSN